MDNISVDHEQSDINEFHRCQSQLQELYSLGIPGSQIEFKAYRILYCVFTNASATLQQILFHLSPEEKVCPTKPQCGQYVGLFVAPVRLQVWSTAFAVPMTGTTPPGAHDTLQFVVWIAHKRFLSAFLFALCFEWGLDLLGHGFWPKRPALTGLWPLICGQTCDTATLFHFFVSYCFLTKPWLSISHFDQCRKKGRLNTLFKYEKLQVCKILRSYFLCTKQRQTWVSTSWTGWCISSELWHWE